MTGKELWSQYQHYTQDFTEHSRKLGLDGVAVCWIFRDEHFKFPVLIYGALLLFVCYFACDILQSTSGALTLRFFAEHQEKKMWIEKGTIEGEINKPRWVDAPAFVMWCLKALFLVAGFFVIGFELLTRLVR